MKFSNFEKLREILLKTFKNDEARIKKFFSLKKVQNMADTELDELINLDPELAFHILALRYGEEIDESVIGSASFNKLSPIDQERYIYALKNAKNAEIAFRAIGVFSRIKKFELDNYEYDVLKGKDIFELVILILKAEREYQAKSIFDLIGLYIKSSKIAKKVAEILLTAVSQEEAERISDKICDILNGYSTNIMYNTANYEEVILKKLADFAELIGVSERELVSFFGYYEDNPNEAIEAAKEFGVKDIDEKTCVPRLIRKNGRIVFDGNI